MKKQTILNTILSLSLLGVGGFSVYKIDDNQKEIAKADIKINELEKTKDSKEKEVNKLKKEVAKQKQELDVKKKELEKTVETSVEKPIQQETPTQSNTQQNNQTTQSVPITEYKVPSEEDNKKMAEQYAKEQEKQNEPVYATMNEYGNLVQFTTEYAISIDKFYELNPGVKVKANQSYRVK